MANKRTELRHVRGLRDLRRALTAAYVGEELAARRIGVRALLTHFGPELTRTCRKQLRRALVKMKEPSHG